MTLKTNSHKKHSAIVLLSGGLDSLVAISQTIKNTNISLALTFDYGQKALTQEIAASKKICKHYSINHKIVKLDWLASLISSDIDWIPNRNALFVNIAACYAEANDIDEIIIGINSEEAIEFKDNSKQFLSKINSSLKNSTNTKVTVKAPLINLTKNDIVTLALNNNTPLKYVYSCYLGGEKHCGYCRSCIFLKNALNEHNQQDLINKLF